MKSKKVLVFAVVMVVIAITVVGTVLSWKNNWQAFWSISVGEVITILVAVFIAYIASQYKENENRIKSYIEKELIELRNLADGNVLYNLQTIGKIRYKQEINLFFTKLDNIIAALEKKENEFKYKNEVKYLENEIKELHDFVSEKIEKYDYLCESVVIYKKHLNKISDKSLEIIFSLYK